MIPASGSAATLRRAYLFMLAGVILSIIAASLIFGARHIRQNNLSLGLSDPAREIPTDASIALLQTEMAINLQQQTINSLGLLALDVALGLLVSALLLTVASGVMLVRSFKANRPLPLEGLDQHLAAVLTGISVSAFSVLEEARRKEADVRKLEQHVADLQALASIDEDQARALRRSLSKSAKWGIVLGVLSVVFTVGIAIWSEMIR